MNILYICADDGIPVRGHKGASVHVRMLIQAFAELGHEVTLLTACPGSADGVQPQARLVQISARASADHPTIQRLLAEQKFDFIYERYSLWSELGADIAEATGIPFILEVNAPLRLEASRYRETTFETAESEQTACPEFAEGAVSIEHHQLSTADHVIVVSNWLAKYVIEQGVDIGRLHVLPNAVDPQRFHPAVRGGAVHHRYGLHDKIVVGFVGRPRPWHDLDTLLTAVSHLHQSDPSYHLLLVGQMPSDLWPRLAAHNLLDAVTVTDAIPHDNVSAHIAAMDVAVSPHHQLAAFYYSPLKLFEYLACGVPTVAARLGQQAKIIAPYQSGYLYPPGSSLALATCIRTLVQDPVKAKTMAWRGATQVLKNHTWHHNATAVLNLINSTSQPETTELPLLDDKLRQRLYRATRPDLAQPLLAKALPMFSKSGVAKLQDVTIAKIFKYKPRRRCVIGYHLTGRCHHSRKTFGEDVIGKVFRDGRGQRLYTLQAQLWHHGFGPDSPDGIHVPQPLAYEPKMRMLVQQQVAGQTLDALAEVVDIAPYIPRSAMGLAKLHDSRLDVNLAQYTDEALRPYTLTNELTQLETYAANLANYRPDDAKLGRRLLVALQLRSTALPAVETAVPIHRDFYYSQILFTKDDLHLIDFDLLALGDPAIDVANFTAHLHLLGLAVHDDYYAYEQEIRQFKLAYARQRRIAAPFWRRVDFYEAATLFRLLQVVAPRANMWHMYDPLLQEVGQRLLVKCVA